MDAPPRSLEAIPLSPNSDSYYNKDVDKKVSENVYIDNLIKRLKADDSPEIKKKLFFLKVLI